MGAGQSIHLDKKSDGCKLPDIAKDIKGLDSDSASPSDTWLVTTQNNVYYDNQEIDHYASIVYNFHTNDGGTEFESGKIPSNEGEAIVFPSHIAHKGVAPVKHKWRLNLNIIVKIKKDELSPFS